MYSAVMAVLSNAVNNWVDFDAWCLTKGFDPLEIPSRRLVAAAWAFLIEGMDEERLEQLIYDLNTEESFSEVKKVQTPKPEDGIIKIDPKTKWKAPEGWRPPGWNEEKSFQSAMGFISFQQSLGQ